MTDTASLHRRLLTLDTHIDIPWPDGPDPFGETRRRVDFPKMLRGGMAGGCFAAYVPQALRTPDNDKSAYARALGMLETICGMGRSDHGIAARVAASADEIAAAWRDGALAVIPAVENGFCIGEDLGRLRAIRELGACYLTLTHNGHNALADAAIPRKDLGDVEAEHGGLSPLGRSAIREMNRLGIAIDVSHASRAAMLQAAEHSRTPVFASHSSIRAVCDHPRNLDDHQLDALRDVDGVVQVTAVAGFLKKDAKPDQVRLADFADHIDHAVRRIGIRHVGISSDFDGGGGFAGWADASEGINVTGELIGRGYGEPELAMLWGGNFLRVLRAVQEAAE